MRTHIYNIYIYIYIYTCIYTHAHSTGTTRWPRRPTSPAPRRCPMCSITTICYFTVVLLLFVPLSFYYYYLLVFYYCYLLFCVTTITILLHLCLLFRLLWHSCLLFRLLVSDWLCLAFVLMCAVPATSRPDVAFVFIVSFIDCFMLFAMLLLLLLLCYSYCCIINIVITLLRYLSVCLV